MSKSPDSSESYNSDDVTQVIAEDFQDIPVPELIKAIEKVFNTQAWRPRGLYQEAYGINIMDFSPELRRDFIWLLFNKPIIDTKTFEGFSEIFMEELMAHLLSIGKRLRNGKEKPKFWLNARMSTAKLEVGKDMITFWHQTGPHLLTSKEKFERKLFKRYIKEQSEEEA